MSLIHSPKITTNGLILCLDAANQKSYSGTGVTFFDLSKNSRNGSLMDGPTFNSTAKIFSFDGLNDRIHVQSPNNLFAWTPSGVGNNSISFEVWVKTNDNDGYIVSKPWNGMGEYNYVLLPYYFNFAIANQSAGGYLSTYLSNNIWNQCVAIITPTQWAVYTNGKINVGFTNHNITNNSPALTYGNSNVELCLMSLYPYGEGWNGVNSFSIQGDFSIFRFYNRVLSSSEILQNFNANRGRFNL